MSHLSPGEMSPMQTATATDLPAGNSPTMHIRLVCQDRKCCILEPAYLPKKPITKKKIFKSHQKKGFLSFVILAICSLTISLHSTHFRVPAEGKEPHMDIVTYRLNQPRGRFCFFPLSATLYSLSILNNV